MSNYQIVTKAMGVSAASNFVESVQTDSSFYVFAAKHTPYAADSDQIIPSPADDIKHGIVDIYNDMIFGKRVESDDVSMMIPRHDWSANTMYVMYDDTSGTLFGNNYYACVNVGSYTNVYKCLYNNNDTPSVVEPSGTDINPFYTPEDGYIWKYMYTADEALMRKFATNDFIPASANALVTAGATAGAIDVIKVEDGGLGYDNYLIGEFTSSASLRIGGSPFLYALGATASSIDNFYNGCLIKMTSGAALDEYRIITDYYVSGGQKIIVLNEPFDGVVTATDTYEINPFVYVFDTSGSKQTNCFARAIVSSNTGNSISRVEVLQPGSGYRFATAVLLPDAVVPVTANASLRVITPPPGGHGSNINTELGASYASVSVKFIQNETPLSTENDYRTVGLLQDPLFANVNFAIDTSNTVGAFAVGENIYQYTPVDITGTVTVSLENPTITGSNTFFSTALSIGDKVIITNGTSNIFSEIAGIANNTSLTLVDSPSFAASGAKLTFTRDASVLGVLIGTALGEIFLDRVNSRLTSDYLVGEQSFATSIIDQSIAYDQRVSISGRAITDGFDKYVQMTKFVGTLDNGTFVEDELITQDNVLSYAQPTARFHSLVDAVSGPNDQMFVTNVRNVFQLTGSPDSDGVISANSGGQFTVVAKYNGDLVPDSGKILYVENLNPITRSNTQSETTKLTFKF